jgi:hypothetical protein
MMSEPGSAVDYLAGSALITSRVIDSHRRLTYSCVRQAPELLDIGTVRLFDGSANALFATLALLMLD